MNTEIPHFSYALGPGEPATTPDDSLWTTSLPVERSAFSHGEEPEPGHITYGDYFSAARHFLLQNDMAIVDRATQQLLDVSEKLPVIDTIRINLLKHGAFYHPAQVVVTRGSRQIELVLNVAVSDIGRQCLPMEYSNLEHLNREMAEGFLPRVFGQGQGDTPGGVSLPMFCGQWLQGYYEFHLTGASESDSTTAVLWDTDTGTATLSAHQIKSILQQAARILAYYFNPITCESIMDWHHGAGDFVVSRKGAEIEVALITVRRYAAMIERTIDPNDPDLEILLNAWLVFLVHISLRLRLDRLDGVGQPTCYGDEVIGAVCKGFWQGLAASFEERGLPAELIDGARVYFGRFQFEDLLDVAQAMLKHHVFQPADAPLLNTILTSHMQHLISVLGEDQSTI